MMGGSTQETVMEENILGSILKDQSAKPKTPAPAMPAHLTTAGKQAWQAGDRSTAKVLIQGDVKFCRESHNEGANV
jgi:hypothetical protein